MPEAGSTVSGSPASGHVVSERASAGGGWPASATFGSGGLEIGGVLAASIAERDGTPAIVIDEEEVRARCREAAALVPRVLFAVKAFTSHAMIRLALDEGLGLLCSTGGEVEACLRAGVPGDRIVMHGSNKSDAELELAVRSGLEYVVADGLDEMRRLDRLARERGTVQPVLLRVVPEVDVETHEAIATGHEASKFGTPIADVVEVARSANGLGGIRLQGLHAHIGSQVLDVTPYLRTLDVLMGL